MKKTQKRFDMSRRPNKPKWYLKIVEYVAAPVYMLLNKGHVKTEKAVKQLKGPYLILASHASFMDFAQMVCGLMPRTTGWVMSVEEFRRGNWLMYGIGGMPKRKFTHDIVTAKHVMRYIKTLNHTCTIYPEARFSLAGINERLDDALGKLCKHLKVPVVLFKANGNFLNSPQWCKRPYRKIRQEAEISLLFTAEDVKTLPAEEMQAKIEKAFERDEYKWQVEKGYHIKSKYRAQGIHKILYKCPACGEEFKMDSEGTKLWCDACGATWEMDTLSRLQGVNTDAGFSHVPDWYNWEREEVRKEVQAGTYHFEDDVRVEDYYSTKVGFVTVGQAHVVHDANGFTFTGEVDGKPFELNKPVSSMYSVHIEYNFLNRGDAFDIATDKTSYFMFLKNAKNYLTKMHFAQEELYDYYTKK
jgi:1-acyl-sn-glycerol-3-phosphate acyltransferase